MVWFWFGRHALIVYQVLFASFRFSLYDFDGRCSLLDETSAFVSLVGLSTSMNGDKCVRMGSTIGTYG